MSRRVIGQINRTRWFLFLGGVIALGGASAIAQECGWHQIEVAGPPARHSHAMAYDSVREVVVLFGGLNGGNERSSVEFGDTWEWDGIQWRQVADTGPEPRMGHAMVYDSAKGVTVLFGRGGSEDTWEWDGVTWTKVADTGPSARGRHGMAYDSLRGVTVVFGGIPRELGDTWEWDGTVWTQLGDNEVLARSRHAMVYDSDRGIMVVFGGMKGSQLRDTLEWDGIEWKQVATSGPPRRMYHAMAYDSARKAIVLFGGWDGTPLADTWEYRCSTDAPQWQVPEETEHQQ